LPYRPFLASFFDEVPLIYHLQRDAGGGQLHALVGGVVLATAYLLGFAPHVNTAP
jgi:hypothetical protein